MPHINHSRGETRKLVFRREHGRTSRDLPKRKNASHRWYRTWINRMHRRQDKFALAADYEDPTPKKRSLKTFMWVCY